MDPIIINIPYQSKMLIKGKIGGVEGESIWELTSLFNFSESKTAKKKDNKVCEFNNFGDSQNQTNQSPLENSPYGIFICNGAT